MIADRGGTGASSWIVEGVGFGFRVGLGFVFGFRLWVVGMRSFMESFPVMGINGMCK